MNRLLSALLIIFSALLYVSCLEDVPVRNNPLDPCGDNFQGWRAPTLSASAPSKGMNYNLSWTDTNAGSYLIEEAKISDFTDATSYPVNSLMHSFSHNDYESSVYYYRVRTNTGNKDSGWSNVVSVEIPPPPWDYVGIKYVKIPGGSFSMGQTGKAEPIHTVTLTAFEMSTTEITQGQYKAVMGSNPSYYTGGDNLPVDQVSWWDAIRFCNALSANAWLDKCYSESTGECDFTKKGYRLPTEAEWEYACRGGKQYMYGTDDGTVSSSKANYGGNVRYPMDVGNYPANPYGLYDMTGNVREWCNDWYGIYTSESVTNPTGPSTGSYRVIHGGAWGDMVFPFNSNVTVTASARGYEYPGDRDWETGFRVVRRPGGVTY
jgi:formylglycine-generating enzyme required for sulfatase activity